MRDDMMIGVDDPALDDAMIEALAEAHAITPAPRLRARVLDRARQDTLDALEARARQNARALRRWRAVGAIAATAVLAVLGYALRQGRIADARTAQLAALASTNAELSSRLDEQGRTLAGPRTITASLGPKEGITASGRVVIDAATGEGAIVVSGLESVGPDRIYELWALRGDRPPEPVGLFTSAEGRALAGRVAPVARLAEVTAFALSIEPAAGSQQPTGPIVMVGPIAS